MSGAAQEDGPLILVVEDEEALAQGIEFNLVHEGFRVERAGTGEAGEARALAAPPLDLVILDVMLPGRDGFAVLQRLRAAGAAVPVILLTARASDVDVVRGLGLGADDYVTKPFSVSQLVARIQAVLRRTRSAPAAPEPRGEGDVLRCPDARIELAGLRIVRGRDVHPLTETEVEIIRILARAPGRVVSRNEILDRLWGPGRYPSTRTVDNHIARIRKKLEPDPAEPRNLVTVHGLGYRLHIDPEA